MIPRDATITVRSRIESYLSTAETSAGKDWLLLLAMIDEHRREEAEKIESLLANIMPE